MSTIANQLKNPIEVLRPGHVLLYENVITPYSFGFDPPKEGRTVKEGRICQVQERLPESEKLSIALTAVLL